MPNVSGVSSTVVLCVSMAVSAELANAHVQAPDVASRASTGTTASLDGISNRIVFRIPNYPLDKALTEWSRQSGLQILRRDDAGETGVISPAVDGRYSPVEALERILTNSGLYFEFINDRTVRIAPVPAGQTGALRQTSLSLAEAEVPGEQQPLSSANAGDGNALDELQITASRIQRSGFEAPTPTTILGVDDIERSAHVSVGEILNDLPSFRASASPTTNVQSSQGSGQSFADLRGLGGVRTLVLVDGRRHAPTTATGQVDLNLIPSILIERVDVVTGGASAAWGSDAVAGVVNLILKKNLDDVQADLQYGQSTYGDDVSYRAAIAAGTRLGDNARFLVGGEYSKSDGIGDIYQRKDGREERGLVSNGAWATNGRPAVIYARGVRQAAMSPGGLITSGPLRGTAFGPGGVPYSFEYGEVFGTAMIGGEGYGYTIPQGMNRKIPVERKMVFGHMDFGLPMGMSGFLEASWGLSESITTGAAHRDQGNITVRVDNAFLPESVRDQMLNLGLATFVMGRNSIDVGFSTYDIGNETRRIAGGFGGAFPGGWKWDAYLQYGENQYDAKVLGNRVQERWLNAIDAVLSPGGEIVCRSSLANPGNGCQPFNLFGDGSPSNAAIDYILGNQIYTQRTSQTAAAFNVSGEPFSTWAGPVSVVGGVEYRREDVHATSDPISQARGFRFGNPQPISGEIDVKEGYGEVVLPLAADRAWARMLDLNAAVRRTSYNLAGNVTTWKLGVSWAVNDDVRLRVTRSRDIRAPNLSELFTSAQTSFLATRNPATGDNFQTPIETRGNPDLKPEKADTLTAGIVYQPHLAPGLKVSLDGYRIDMAGQITSIGGQAVVDRCYAGGTEYCPLVILDGTGRITRVINPQLNLNSFRMSGMDMEAVYAFPASFMAGMRGKFLVRALASHVMEMVTTDGSGSVDRVGETGGVGVPKWLASASLGYTLGRGEATLTGRYISSGTMDNRTHPNTSTSRNINYVPARTYVDVTGQFDLREGSDRPKLQIFGVIDNLLNVRPPFPVGASLSVAGTYFDVVGRTYRMGMRVRY